MISFYYNVSVCHAFIKGNLLTYLLTYIPFWIDRAISAGGGNFAPFFATKLVAMATSLKISEKEGRIVHLEVNTYHTVQRLSKTDPVDPEILWLQANNSGTTQNWLPWQRPLRNRKNWT